MHFFNDIKTCFTKLNKGFKAFLSYFETNWLPHAFINFKSEDQEELNDRTNNICEGFNSLFNKHIGMKRSSLSMFISKLKELEFKYRQQILNKIGHGVEHISEVIPDETKLPLRDINNYILQYQKEIESTKYNLRSMSLKTDFLTQLLKLSHECFNFFFSEDDLVENNINEEGKF